MARMRRFLRKVLVRLAVATVAGLALLAVGVALHIREGGSLKEAARPALDAWRGLVEKGQSVAGQSARGEDKPDSTTGTGDGRIAVYFAPCAPFNPVGIDDRLVAFLKDAKRSVYCAFYELQLPEAADALINQHQAGVDVRIVTDSEYKDREALRRCMAVGIPVVFDDRSPFMHNKFCVVDSGRVWTGSMNVTENGAFRNNNNAVLLASEELAADYSAEFLEMFEDKAFGGRSPRNTHFVQMRVGEALVECYFAPEDKVLREIVSEIEEANKGIDFMAFSFTSDDIAQAMAKRMKQGVRVRGLFERRCAGSKYSRDEYLAERGAEIYLDENEHTMHHKVIVIDGETVITGSYNFSASAEEKNDENVLILHAPAIARAYVAEFERLLPH